MISRKSSSLSLFLMALFLLLPSVAIAKDNWIQVRSKNFFLVGNASEKEIRRVATKLEQFRETFRNVFRSMTVDSPIPTNVVVFKSESSFKPFKPRRGDGKADTMIAGYFQPGEDVNYVTLSTEGTDAETYGTIFHEYVHFLVETNFGKSNVPSWFNEGLAEYYSTFQIEEDQNAKLGLADGNHLELLAQSKFIPLKELFENRPGNYGGSHSRSIFYAQSWALIHYLVQTGKSAGLDKFVLGSQTNKNPEQVFREAFGMGYADMEKELRKYVGQRLFKYHNITFKNKLVYDTEMVASPLSEGESNTYLGDLLYHTHRPDDAEPFLRTALSLEPDSSFANTAMGMVKIRQRKYADAKSFLDKATKDGKNHVAFFRYAELLLRESQDEFGYMDGLDPAVATRMRQLLKKAIELKPSFTESYELLSLVSIVTNEHLDEALAGLGAALKYRPGHPQYGMRAAEIYLRQDKFKEALSIVDKLAKHADDDQIRARAQQIASSIREREQMFARYETAGKAAGDAESANDAKGERSSTRRSLGSRTRSPEEAERSVREASNRAVSEALRTPVPGENRVVGEISAIDCKGDKVGYSVTTPNDNFMLTSADFQNLFVMAYIDNFDKEIGCEAKLSGHTVVLSYKPDAAAKAPLRGELVAIEFVPKGFRIVEAKPEAGPTNYVVAEVASLSSGQASAVSPPPAMSQEQAEKDFAALRRNAMLKQIAESIRKPEAGESRFLGFITRSECTNKGIFFSFRSGGQVLKIKGSEQPQMRAYTPDIENVQIGCGMKDVDVPVVVVYKVSSEKKPKVAGDLVSMEFVPKSFQLDQ